MDESDKQPLREILKNVVDMADEEMHHKLDGFSHEDASQQRFNASDPQSSESMMLLKGGSISAVVRANGEVKLSDFGAP